MADDADMASDIAELERLTAIRNAITRPKIRFTGVCLNCGESLEQGRYCDASCADDFAKRKRMNGHKL